ncbi:hypothetical protein [Flavobacterium sp.]|uniref:hypothetical protein n=1 Tax=Flavobacterium sp. TaxID=239 RepID=UPI002608375B|nr:hypothetical protein [Flavobacterium sp.]
MIILFGFISIIINGQCISNEYLQGRWEEDKGINGNFIIFFSYETDGELNTKIISSATGNEIKVLSARIEGGEFYLVTFNENHDWYALSKYTKIDANTMEVSVKNEYGTDKLTYKRVR